jgi:hypothetical protein
MILRSRPIVKQEKKNLKSQIRARMSRQEDNCGSRSAHDLFHIVALDSTGQILQPGLGNCSGIDVEVDLLGAVVERGEPNGN